MSRKAFIRSFTFQRGLETTAGQRTEDPFTFPVFLNSRVHRGNAARRAGMVKLVNFAAPNVLMTFDGVDDFIGIPPDLNPTRPDFRSLHQWAVETLFRTTNVATNRTVIGASSSTLPCGLKVTHNTAGSVVTQITDTAANVTTITHTGVPVGADIPYQARRDDAALSVTVNGVVQTALMNPTNFLDRQSPFAIGADGGLLLYLGRIDFFRAFNFVKTHVIDGRARLLLPRKPSVIFDYVLEPTADNFVLDRGRLGLHARATGSPVKTSASLAINPAPILAIAVNRNEDAQQQGYVRVGSVVHPTRF
jgi:hypothetical protein